MSRHSMAQYAERARSLDDPLLASARYPVQREAERRVILDVAAKLDLRPFDDLLDIGAGIGNLTIPLSYLVDTTTVIDHADCLARLERRAPGRVEAIAGDFLALDLGRRRFDKILVYATLHYLADPGTVHAFVRKACGLLRIHGRMLLGDLPNIDSKRRFTRSGLGAVFMSWWDGRAEIGMAAERHLVLPPDRKLVAFDDAAVIGLVTMIRSLGYHAYLVSQPDDLPFGRVREDILVEAP